MQSPSQDLTFITNEKIKISQEKEDLLTLPSRAHRIRAAHKNKRRI